MKLKLTLAIILCTVSAQAQWAVYDAAVHTQIITSSAQEIAKFVEMINNQVQQIRTLTSQLNEFKHYEDLFGDPKSVVIPTGNLPTLDLKQAELGKGIDQLVKTAEGAHALAYNGAGIYHSVGETFTTPGGQTLSRSTNEYRPFAAVHRISENYTTVSTNVEARRIQIKNQIAATTEQLRGARTDAEVQKLNGLLVSLSADLSSADHEVHQALASALIQDIDNRNNEAKERLARREQQNAEFSETVSNYGHSFRLLTTPVAFPKK